MKIKHITLQTNKLVDMKNFYTKQLQMDLINETDDSFTLNIGASTLTYNLNDDHSFYHIAFCLNDAIYDDFIEKLSENHSKLQDKNGNAEFSSQIWQRKQIYFHDPQGNVIEFMPSIEERTGTESLWSHIQEIGMPVQNVQLFRSQLHPINSVFNSESNTFSFFGDKEGVLVITKVSRPWFPTVRKSEVHPIAVVVEAESPLNVTFTDLPYTISS